MTNEASKPPRPGRLRRWLKRIGLGFLVLVLLLAIFHRPIIFEGTRYFVVRAAKQQNLDIDYDISGSIFSTLTVSNLVGTPTEPGPIQRLEIGTIDLRYSLWGAIRRGLPALLDLVAVKDVYIEITPGEEPPPEKKDEPQQLKFPALFPRTLLIENVNFLSHAPTGDTVIEGLWFTLLPDQPGVLKAATIDIPGVHKWTDLSGATTFANRNLLLTDFHIGSEIRLKRFNLDASKLDDARLGLALEGTVLDAPIALDARIDDLNATNDLTLSLSLSGLVLDKIWSYLDMDPPAQGTVQRFAIDFAGRPEEPRSWGGTIDITASGLSAAGQALGDLALAVQIAGGQADITLSDRFDGENSLQVVAANELPETLGGFLDAPTTGTLTLAFPDLSAIPSPQPLAGDLSGTVEFALRGAVLTAKADVRSQSLTAGEAGVAGAGITLEATKNLRSDQDAPPFAALEAKVAVAIESVRFADYATDGVNLEGAVKDAEVALGNLSIARGSNRVTLRGNYTLPADMKSFASQPWRAHADVEAPKLDEFLVAGGGADLAGSLAVKGDAQSDEGRVTGDFDIIGRDIAVNGLAIPTIDGKLHLADDRAEFPQLKVVLDDNNWITASGQAELKEPYLYQGSLDVNLEDLAVFDPLSPEPLAGALSVKWQGTGDVQKGEHAGGGTVLLRNGQFGAQVGLNAAIEANYTPEMIDIPVLQAGAEMGGLAAKVHWERNELAVTALVARLKDLTVLTGSLAVPLDLAHAGNLDLLIPNDGAVNVALTIPEFALATLFAQLGPEDPPATGSVSGKISATGTIADLTAEISLAARDIEAVAAEGVQPADVTLNLAVKNDHLVIDGRITEPRINPLVIKGDVPLDLVQLKKAQKIPPGTPLDLSVKMADSPLAFVSGLVPAIRFIDGVAGIDVAVSGTIEKPLLVGSVSADISHLRLANEDLPPITNIAVRIDSTTGKLTISRFRGEIAGGSFGAEGTVDFSNPGQPIFDVAMGSKDALVLQNEAVTARISSRIDIDGPLDSATVSGKVYVTKSRFYKDIDILPIGLPGRPAPEPPPAPEVPGIPNPPLRDWKFDIDVKTADPFLVEGNLANGRILIDLHIGGTGMDPWVDGGVRIEKLETSLPFSTLTIDNGLVYFAKDRPFLPQFDIRGTSQIRDYNVTAYIYGDLTNPQATFTSNPPLPQTEIVSLIATGVTSKELAGNPSVLAGKAAMLLFQKLYRTVFKRGDPGPKKDTLLSRIDLDLGETDPKTGRQAAAVRFPLTDDIVLVGGLDVSGNFRGQVKYLIRFR